MNSSFILTPGSPTPPPNVHGSIQDQKAAISDAQLAISLSVTSALHRFFSILGIVCNLINIRVFVVQGVSKSSTNIGLFSLSLFDFLHCLFMFPPGLCFIFDFTQDRYNRLVCKNFSIYWTSSAIVFYNSGHWTTVYLAIERTLCVVMPLKVKFLIRTKVTARVIPTFPILFFFGLLVYVASLRIGWYYDALANRTVPFLSATSFGARYVSIYRTVLNTVLSTAAMVVVAVTTAVMIYKLKKFQQWRQKNATTVVVKSSGNNNNNNNNDNNSATSDRKQIMSTKDAEMVKSVVIVTSVFLVCLLAAHIPGFALLLYPGATFGGRNENLFRLTYGLRFVFGLINSSINIFFYIRVSSRYREAFAAAFPRCAGLVSTNGKIE